MKTEKYCALLSVALFALPALAWDGLINGNRLSCDFVADGIVRVQFVLGGKLQDNATGAVMAARKVSVASTASTCAGGD